MKNLVLTRIDNWSPTLERVQSEIIPDNKYVDALAFKVVVGLVISDYWLVKSLYLSNLVDKFFKLSFKSF
jgi:hypothetical protein